MDFVEQIAEHKADAKEPRPMIIIAVNEVELEKLTAVVINYKIELMPLLVEKDPGEKDSLRVAIASESQLALLWWLIWQFSRDEISIKNGTSQNKQRLSV